MAIVSSHTVMSWVARTDLAFESLAGPLVSYQTQAPPPIIDRGSESPGLAVRGDDAGDHFSVSTVIDVTLTLQRSAGHTMSLACEESAAANADGPVNTNDSACLVFHNVAGLVGPLGPRGRMPEATGLAVGGQAVVLQSHRLQRRLPG